MNKLRKKKGFLPQRIFRIENNCVRDSINVTFRNSMLLDGSSTGPHWLNDRRIAQIAADAIRQRDGKTYQLLSYCIMPNHVHMVITVERSDTSLYRILQSLKAYTARECNKVLQRTGQFWQRESYDDVVRNGKELERIISYVIDNPEIGRAHV